MAEVKAAQIQQIEFIKDFLRQGKKRNFILERFRKKWKELGRATFDNRLKIAKEQMQDEFKAIEKKTDSIITQAVEARTAKILTAIERQEILTEIALGKIPLKKPMVVDGTIELIDVVPDWMDRKNAIAELNKMDGSYAPAKSEINISEAPSIIIPGKKKKE